MMWLDFIEDMRKFEIKVAIKIDELTGALFLEIMKKYKPSKFFMLGKEDKLEVIKPNG